MFRVAAGTRAGQGTSVTLKLKEADPDGGLQDYTDEWVVRGLIKQYSDFVRYPIVMKVSRKEPEKDEEGKEKPDGKQITVVEDQTLNSMKAIWKRRAAEVEEKEYEQFYRHISHNWDRPRPPTSRSRVPIRC